MSVTDTSVSNVYESTEFPVVKHYIRQTIVAVDQGVGFQKVFIFLKVIPGVGGGSEGVLLGKKMGVEKSCLVIFICGGEIGFDSVWYGFIKRI